MSLNMQADRVGIGRVMHIGGKYLFFFSDSLARKSCSTERLASSKSTEDTSMKRRNRRRREAMEDF